ncbi:hypothetical protein [Phenylobacterium sp.]|uniref:hypothetical protein n=1 Tax=Phenylobacterium sp. TaxID=1871053 RepID=UPI0025CEFDF7|nr:hypothetical protein [Phenylobacterium sp.]
MIKSIVGGVAAAALLSGPGHAAPAHTSAHTPAPKAARAPAAGGALAWVVTPTETGCRADLELTSHSGAITPVSLISDGQLVSLRFFKEDLPARAFLPIRIDKARFSNLMLRGADGSGELVLSEESEAALRKGGTLGIAWLTEEPLSAALGGSEQGLADLRICGAQTASRHRERVTTELAVRERTETEARAKALNDAQLAAVQAQVAAAEAQRRQVEDVAERQRRADAEEAAERQRRADAAIQAEAQAAQDRAYREARQRAYDEAERRRVYPPQDQDDDPRWAPPPYYPPPRYRDERY